MVHTLIGTKKGQTQWFDTNGKRHPVTVMEIGPCSIVQIKKTETDGYSALQLGTGNKHPKNVNKPQKGHFKKARLTKKQPRFLREIRFKDDSAMGEDVKLGDSIAVDQVFYPGDHVNITSVSKGKGFAGVMKRWGFAGGPATHGQSDRQRSPGSIGGTSTPGRVYKGKKMAGRMGGDTVTLKGLKVATVDSKTNELTITGLVPGAVGSLVSVTLVKAVDRPEVEEEAKDQVETVSEAIENSKKEEVKTEEKPKEEEKKQETVEEKKEDKAEKVNPEKVSAKKE